MAQRYWIGVVGMRETWTRLIESENRWWCMPVGVQVGDQLAMYLTRTASAKHTGVFGLFEIEKLDASRNSTCMGFGKPGTTCNQFADLKLNHLVASTLTLSQMKSDDVLRTSLFVRHNAQGTTFALSKHQYERVKSRCMPNKEEN